MTDNHARGPEETRDQLREEAAAWFARMRGEDAEGHRPDFEKWLARGALHRAAYNRIGEIFAAGKALKARSDDLAVAARRPSRVSLSVATAAGATVLLLLLVWQAAPGKSPKLGDRQEIASNEHQLTALEAKRFHLTHGASVVLDSDSFMVTRVGGAMMVTRLERGRARFDVPPGETAQTVLAGPAEVTSAGGTFDLWVRSDGSLDAQVLVGRVGLRPAVWNGFVGKPSSPLGLKQGQHYRMTSLGRGSLLAEMMGRDWPNRILEFRRTPLADVLEEVNRYDAVKIVLADPALGLVRVSGRFRIDEPLKLAKRLATILALHLDESSAGVIILRRGRNISAAS